MSRNKEFLVRIKLSNGDDFGEILKGVSDHLALTPQILSDMLQVSRTSIERWLKNECAPGVHIRSYVYEVLTKVIEREIKLKSIMKEARQIGKTVDYRRAIEGMNEEDL